MEMESRGFGEIKVKGQNGKVVKAQKRKMVKMVYDTHMPQKNGRAEHFNRTYMDKAETMHHNACLPRSWWEFCVEYVIHIYNRTPIKRLNNKTPYQLVYGNKPDVSHLRNMGCGAYIFLHEYQWVDKLSPHTEYMTFIGLTNGVKGWKFMHNSNTIFHATKAVFNKNNYL